MSTDKITGMWRSDTDKAILFRFPIDNGDPGYVEDTWIPKSQIGYTKKEDRGAGGKWWTVTLPTWLIEKNRLIVDDMLPKDYYDRSKQPELDLPPGIDDHEG